MVANQTSLLLQISIRARQASHKSMGFVNSVFSATKPHLIAKGRTLHEIANKIFFSSSKPCIMEQKACDLVLSKDEPKSTTRSSRIAARQWCIGTRDSAILNCSRSYGLE